VAQAGLADMTTRFVPALAALVLMLLLKPWDLRWWMIDVGVGLVLFAFAAFRDPSKPEPRDVWMSFAVATALWLVGLFAARYNGLTLEEMVSDRSVSKHIRRIPDYAVVFATFSVLFSVWSMIPSLREQRDDT
jgi:hypothetical protein